MAAVAGDKAPALKVGDCIVAVDPRYFRPAEVETLLGDPAKAKQKLGWEPEISALQMCEEMVAVDLDAARRHALLRAHGLEMPVSRERADRACLHGACLRISLNAHLTHALAKEALKIYIGGHEPEIPAYMELVASKVSMVGAVQQ